MTSGNGRNKLKVIQGARKVAVVTGAGRGIGRAMLDILQQRGYLVVAVVRSLSDVRDLFSIAPHDILPIRADVTEASTEQVLREFLDGQVEKVDLLINNAGFGASGYGVEGMKYEELDRVLAVHCYGPIRCVRACLPFLRNSENATIINISSRFASLEWVSSQEVPASEATYPYRIGKAALNMFTSCLAVELEPENIRVLSVDPGKVKTRFGPKDADTEPADAAQAIIDLAENNDRTGMFLHASGDRQPW